MKKNLVVLVFLALLPFVLGNNLYIKQAVCCILQYIYLHLPQNLTKVGKYVHGCYGNVILCFFVGHVFFLVRKNWSTNRGREDVSRVVTHCWAILRLQGGEQPREKLDGVDLTTKEQYLAGGFKHFLFSPLPGEMIQFDEHIFQMGWFNHQLDMG